MKRHLICAALATVVAAATAQELDPSLYRADEPAVLQNTTVIRLVGLDKAENGQKTKDLDYQTVEMESIARFAQYIAEVNFVRDPQSKGGFEPRITVISTSTGEIVADVIPDELYKLDQGAGRWTTTENGVVRQSVEGDGAWTTGETGIQKKTRKVTSIEDGHRVAVALMQQLTETLPADMPKKNVSP